MFVDNLVRRLHINHTKLSGYEVFVSALTFLPPPIYSLFSLAFLHSISPSLHPCIHFLGIPSLHITFPPPMYSPPSLAFLHSIQATGLDAWASRVKCPARFVSHLHDICIWVVYSFCLVCCLFIIVTTQFVAWYTPCKPKPKPSTYNPPDNHPLAEIQRPMLRPEPKQQICHQHANTDHFGK